MRAFGAKPLDQVTKNDVAALVDTMVEAGRAPRTVNLTLGLLRQAMNAAVREGTLQRNVAVLVDRLPQKHQEMAAWTAEEARTFLTATQTTAWPGRGR